LPAFSKRLICGYLDFLWPFASQKKQINVIPILSNLNACSQLAALFRPNLSVLISLSIFAGLGAVASADIFIAVI
jgi:hypothetical protein